MLIKKKSQAWIQDAIISIIIIIVAFGTFMIGYSNLFKDRNLNYNDLYEENRLISEYLMLEGTPIDWNESNVLKIGIVNSDNSINITKLKMLNNLTLNNYEDSKEILGTKFDYMIFFTNYNDSLINLTTNFIGCPGINNTNILNLKTKIVTNTERFVIRKDKNTNYKEIIKMNIYSWE